jgi:hypothetical protein
MAKSVLLLVLLAAGSSAACHGRQLTLSPSEYEPFRRKLTSIYQLELRKLVKQQGGRTPTTAQAKALVQAAKQARDITITSAVARRRRSGGHYVVKVTYTVGGTTPPDGRTARYFLARKRALGWTVRRETSASRFR